MKGYDALCAKSRAMHGGMLKQKDYETLSKLEQIDEAVQYLARTPRYAEAFRAKSRSGGGAGWNSCCVGSIF